MAGPAEEPPIRIRWVLDLLEVAPDEQLLEFGCGTGVAVSMVADRLRGGCITAIDRSAVAVSRTRSRNTHHLESGRVVVEQASLAEFRSDRRFDKAFGVNVNLFWTTPADAECQCLETVLASHGIVHLVYDTPGERDGFVTDQVASTLTRHGFRTGVSRGPTSSLVCITGRSRHGRSQAAGV